MTNASASSVRERPASKAVKAAGSTPRRWLWLLHGFLGSGDNWQSFARSLVQRRPDWGCLLVDLRLHGGSAQLPPPHSMDAIARDLRELAATLGEPRAIAGHSFGGRAALHFASTSQPTALRQLWVLDAAPASRQRRADSTTLHVLSALRELPPSFADRRAFTSALEQRAVGKGIALWLAKNLERHEGTLRLRLQLDALQALLDDHDRCDCWPWVETHPPEIDLHFVLAGHDSAVEPVDQERLQVLAGRGALSVERLASAGHWLHVDDPAGLLEVLLAGLSE